jgi:hypothetical protein
VADDPRDGGDGQNNQERAEHRVGLAGDSASPTNRAMLSGPIARAVPAAKSGVFPEKFTCFSFARCEKTTPRVDEKQRVVAGLSEAGLTPSHLPPFRTAAIQRIAGPEQSVESRLGCSRACQSELLGMQCPRPTHRRTAGSYALTPSAPTHTLYPPWRIATDTQLTFRCCHTHHTHDSRL